YSEADFDARPEFTEPEILRTGLASVLLQMLSLGLGEVSEFPILQAPDPRGVADGINLLLELGAIRRVSARDDERPADRGGKGGRAGRGRRGSRGAGARSRSPYRLTEVGRALARLPIDPRFGRMVVESKEHDVSR